MLQLTNLTAREVLDSRGNPTVEVTAFTDQYSASAIVPSGASTGVHEAVELRDGDAKRYLGKGVLKAVSHVTTDILPAVKGMDVFDQQALDAKMIALDGTPNKGRLGANAILGVSMACARLAAVEKKLPLFQYLNAAGHVLPTPMMNVINGGKHADSGLDIQEFMIMPVGAPSFREGLRMGVEVFHALKKILSEGGYSTAVGDEGGFAPALPDNESALVQLVKATEKAGYKPGVDIAFAIDAASSEFYDKEKNIYKTKNGNLTASELLKFYNKLLTKYPIVSIEDGFAEDDWSAWEMMTAAMSDRIQIVADDLLVTNVDRLQKGIDQKAANSILIKLNQIGTVTETISAITMARAAGWKSVVSHRSGETEDAFIADFSVAMETSQIKTGSLCRTDRVAKYNQLLRIEEMLGEKAVYLGGKALLFP